MDLGAMAEKEIVSEKDPKRAYEFYEKAASMGNPDALIALSTTGSHHLKPSDAVNKVCEMGSMGAANILNAINIFAPKANKNASTYAETLKTLNNFYASKNTSRSRA